MRQIPDFSTDLLYSAFPAADLMEMGRALGVSDLKFVTTATLKPTRVLYHACLNGIQTYVKLKPVAELERALEIADMADAMAAALRPQFDRRVVSSRASLERRQREAAYFCERLHHLEDGKPWSKRRFETLWNANDYPHRWQKKVVETYGLIRARMASGDYAPPEGQGAASLTDYWSLRNLEYKHYRGIARDLVESYIQRNFSRARLLTMRPSCERMTTFFIGGMGSGKSTMTEQYLARLPEPGRHDMVLHNADYLKYALYRSALKEGCLPSGHGYRGEEVQAESSNALYEGTRKRCYLARQKFQAPDVILNSIVLGSFEIQEGLASGGKIVVHHIYIDPADAVLDAEKRREAIGRAPSADDILWSAAASAKSLLLLAQPHLRGTDITMHLYRREAGKPPEHYGTIDALNAVLYISNPEIFKDLSESALGHQANASELAAQFSAAGYSVIAATYAPGGMAEVDGADDRKAPVTENTPTPPSISKWSLKFSRSPTLPNL